MIKRSLGHHTKEKQLFLEKMTSVMYCVGQVRINEVKKGTGTGKLKGYPEGRNKIRKVIYRIDIIKLIFKS